MQSLKKYIDDRYQGNMINFLEGEVQSQQYRINKVLSNKNYLNGVHKILEKRDGKWKGKEFKTTKLVLQNIKSILNFHDTYLLGKPVSLNGSDSKVKVFNNVYKKAHYNKLDFDIKRKVNRYGDCYEYVYWDNNSKNIKSKVINPEDGYPVFAEDTGNYIGFIEYYTTKSNGVSYYNIYYPERVEEWNNEGGYTHKTGEYINISGLPIHYKSYSDFDERFGESSIKDIKPIIDLLEDLLSKMTDSVYTLSLNPIAVSNGNTLKNSIDAELVGTVLELDGGDFKFENTQMDYNTIKLLLDTLNQQLSVVASMPSTALGNSNIANVSEVSLSMLYNLAEARGMLDEKVMKEGFEERWEKIESILSDQGITFNIDEYIDCEFNYSKPINKQELIQNLEKLRNMNAISIKSIIEKSDIVTDVTGEIERLKEEQSKVTNENFINNDCIVDNDE